MRTRKVRARFRCRRGNFREPRQTRESSRDSTPVRWETNAVEPVETMRAPSPTVSDRAVGGALRRTFTFRTLLTTLIFDICGPLLTYRVLHAAGASDVVALISSGVPPALGVAVAAKRHHRLDVIGALVLLGVLIGTSLGLLTHDPKLVLLEGAVPTLLFSLACLVSVLLRRPLMFVLLRAMAGTRGITAA